MTEVTGIIANVIERGAGSGFCDGERAAMAARQTEQMFCCSPDDGSSRPQLMQFGMEIS